MSLLAAVADDRFGDEIELRDVDDALPRLAEADTVLLTFEIPQRSLERAILRLREPPGRDVILIVTPGQPYAGGGVAGQAFAEVNCVRTSTCDLRATSAAIAAKRVFPESRQSVR